MSSTVHVMDPMPLGNDDGSGTLADAFRYIRVEGGIREAGDRQVGQRVTDIDLRLERIERIALDVFEAQKSQTAIARSGRSAARTTAGIAGAGAVAFVATNWETFVSVARFARRLFP